MQGMHSGRGLLSLGKKCEPNGTPGGKTTSWVQKAHLQWPGRWLCLAQMTLSGKSPLGFSSRGRAHAYLAPIFLGSRGFKVFKQTSSFLRSLALLRNASGLTPSNACLVQPGACTLISEAVPTFHLWDKAPVWEAC